MECAPALELRNFSHIKSRSAALRLAYTVITSDTLNLVKKPGVHKIYADYSGGENMSDKKIHDRQQDRAYVGAASDPATVATISADHSLFGSEIVDHQRLQSRQPLIGQRWKALAQNWNAR